MLLAALGTVLSCFAQQPAFLTNGLVAYYPFNGNAKDASGNGHDGVNAGATLTKDRFGQENGAYRFSNGTMISVVNPKDGTFDLNHDITISAWVSMDSLSGNNIFPIASMDVGGGTQPKWIFGIWPQVHDNVTGNNLGGIGFDNTIISPKRHEVSEGSLKYQPSQVIHCVVSKRNGVAYFYANGLMVFSESMSDINTVVPSSAMTIGFAESTVPSFPGVIDDVRFYNRGLTDVEVSALYRYESTPPDNSYLTNGLVAYYPFNGDAKDASGNGNDLTTVGSPSFAVVDRVGKTGNAVNFGGNGDYFFLNKSLQGTAFVKTPMTISFWRQGKGANTAVGVENGSTGLWVVGGESKNELGNDENFGINGGRSPFSVNLVLNESVWVQTVYVWNGTDSAISTNGVSVLKGSLPSFGVPPSDSRLYIGADPYAGFEYWNGAFDEVRIYNRALSDFEVAALYQYESVPQKTDPRQATATATVVNGFVVGATITDVGSGYTKAPKVVISGGGGTGATATATIDANGSVNSITIVSSGSKYTGTPTITIDPPPFPPSQAKGTSTVINGFVTGVNITDTGHGYEGVVPPVTFLGGGGKGATGTAIVSNGMVTGISMTASGSGYTNAPYVLIAAPPGLASAAISVRTVDVTLSLIPGYTYKIQTTTDAGTTWVDVETGILAVDKTLVRSFDVTSQTQLFRVVQVN